MLVIYPLVSSKMAGTSSINGGLIGKERPGSDSLQGCLRPFRYHREAKVAQSLKRDLDEVDSQVGQSPFFGHVSGFLGFFDQILDQIPAFFWGFLKCGYS